MVIGARSPRSTAPKNTLLLAPRVTLPRTVALSATKAEGWMTGFFMAAPRKSFSALYHNFPGKSTVTVKFVLTFFVRICYTDVR